MMNARDYRVATMPGGAKASEAKAQRAADGREIAQATQSRWLAWMIDIVRKVQNKALARTDGQHIPGLFELIAVDVAKAFPLGSASIRLIGFVGELAGDAVQSTVDLWAAQLLEQETIGSNEASGSQIAFLTRGKNLRAAKNWVGKLKSFGIVTPAGSLQAADYTATLSPLLFAADVDEASFRSRLLAKALGMDYTGEKALIDHAAVQFARYTSELNREQRRRRATDAPRYQARADADTLASILAGNSPFDTAPAE